MIPFVAIAEINDWVITLIVGALTFLVPLAVYFVNLRLREIQLFHKYSYLLSSANESERNIAAIALRRFIKKKRFRQQSIERIVKLLTSEISADLQKTLADTLSFAGNLDGQDLQHIQMIDALIKPQYAIDFELHKRFSKKNRRLSMQGADLYQSVIVMGNLNFLDAEKAHFYCSILTGTSFKNCILRNADFRCANVEGVKFDKDCVLEGACFKNAIGLDSAIFIDTTNHIHSIESFLDENGIFCTENKTSVYTTSNEKMFVFISKLGMMDSSQVSHYNKIISIINQLEGVETVTIDRNNYTKVAQLIDVKSKMDVCSGCVIFAFDYLQVNEGTVHKNVIGDDCKKVENMSFASPWLHIETALANAKQLPCLVIYDEDLFRDGMFDQSIIGPDTNLYALPYSDAISLTSPEIQKWFVSIREKWSRKKLQS